MTKIAKRQKAWAIVTRTGKLVAVYGHKFMAETHCFAGNTVVPCEVIYKHSIKSK